MLLKDTPPSSPDFRAEIMELEDEIYDDEVVEVIDDEASVPEGTESTTVEDNSSIEDDSDTEEEGRTKDRDDAVYVFSRHKGSIFSCNLDPKTASMAVTGGEDDSAYLWEALTGKIILDCKGHKDSVTCVDFSHDGSYIATGDMSGIVKVWKLSSKQIAFESHVGDLSWLKWHHGTMVLIAGTEAGEVYMWKIPGGDCKVLPGHGDKANCGCILPDGKRVVVGYDDGAIKIFDLKAATVLFHIPVDAAHVGTVTDIDCHEDNNLIISGGIDGNAILIKSQTGKVVSVLDCRTDMPERNNMMSVESVGFCPVSSLSLAAAGSLDGILFIWDISKGVLRHKINDRGGITKLSWLKDSSMLLTGCLDGIIRVYEARNGTLQNQLYGHSNSILSIAVSKDGRSVLSGSDDKTARIFHL